MISTIPASDSRKENPVPHITTSVPPVLPSAALSWNPFDRYLRCIYSALIFGALSILFALLSRGGEMKMSERAFVGLVLGITGLVIAVAAFAFMFLFTVNTYGGFDAFMQYSNELAEQYMQMQ